MKKFVRCGIGCWLRLLVATCCLASAAYAQDASAPVEPAAEKTSINPGINDNFLDPNLDVEQWLARFEVESREVFAAQKFVLEELHLKPGMIVADIGAGTGLYTFPFARAVGAEGFVFAVDISAKFIEHLAAESERLNLPNVGPVLCAGDSVRLPPKSIDLAFICDVYHHFEFPQATLASLRRAMRPGGRLVVIDFERIPGVSREWTIGHVRAGKETFQAEIEQAGFEFAREVEVEGFSENYFLEFRVPGAPQ